MRHTDLTRAHATLQKPHFDIQVMLGAGPLYSFIIPAFNEQATIEQTILNIVDAARQLAMEIEILVVDDGSSDTTFETARDMADRFPVRVLQLSRNFGKEQAIAAGLAQCQGDAAIILDADLQEPLSCLHEMLQAHKSGYDMVYAVRQHRDDETRLKRMLTRLFYAALSFDQDLDIPPDARDFRIMDRKVIDALNALPERDRFMKGLYGWVGFRTKAIPIEVSPRPAGQSKFGLRGLTRLGLTGLTSFSTWPLRISTCIGLLFSAISIGYACYIGVKTLLWGGDVPGFATLSVAILFLGGLQLMSIGVLGEYLARVFTEVKGRPGYVIARDVNGPATEG